MLPACKTIPGQASRPREENRHWVTDTLYFGLDSPRGQVTEAQWQAFLAEVVTPRFPGGFTAWEAQGQWRDKTGKVVREPSRVLQLMHLDGQADEKAVREIVEDYKKRFAQESVMRVEGEGKISF